MSYETLAIELRDGVARVTLDRPERLNALSGQMFLELERFAGEVAASPGIRVVVLTGRGRAFCSGADLRSYTSEVDMSDPHQIRDRMRLIARVVRAWRHLDVPTLAAVNGVAVGGGANLALMCDLVVMREDATIAQSYIHTGMVPDMAATYLVPRLVGPAKAAELLLLGDPISASEAERIGLVNRCVGAADFEDAVNGLAGRLATAPPRSIELILTGLRQAPRLDLDATLEWEATAIALAMSTDVARQAIENFPQPRRP